MFLYHSVFVFVFCFVPQRVIGCTPGLIVDDTATTATVSGCKSLGTSTPTSITMNFSRTAAEDGLYPHTGNHAIGGTSSVSLSCQNGAWKHGSTAETSYNCYKSCFAQTLPFYDGSQSTTFKNIPGADATTTNWVNGQSTSAVPLNSGTTNSPCVASDSVKIKITNTNGDGEHEQTFAANSNAMTTFKCNNGVWQSTITSTDSGSQTGDVNTVTCL